MIETPAQILSHHADADASDSFIAWRKRIRKPLTERAAVMLAKTLSAINEAGGDATEALDMAQERGWMTIKPTWYFSAKDAEHDNRNRNPRGNTCPDATAQQIAFAARSGRSPSEDSF